MYVPGHPLLTTDAVAALPVVDTEPKEPPADGNVKIGPVIWVLFATRRAKKHLLRTSATSNCVAPHARATPVAWVIAAVSSVMPMPRIAASPMPEPSSPAFDRFVVVSV